LPRVQALPQGLPKIENIRNILSHMTDDTPIDCVAVCWLPAVRSCFSNGIYFLCHYHVRRSRPESGRNEVSYQRSFVLNHYVDHFFFYERYFQEIKKPYPDQPYLPAPIGQ